MAARLALDGCPLTPFLFIIDFISYDNYIFN
jgi:hypothetical protein